MKIKKSSVLAAGTIVLFAISAVVFAQGFGPDNLPPQAKATPENHAPVCTPEPGGFRCHSHVAVDKSGGPSVTLLPNGYGPREFHGAYTSATTVSGNKILAIVDAYDDPNIFSDLNTYSNTFSIPSLPLCSGSIASSAVPCFKKVNQRGSTTYPSVSSGWALEISLDVEAAHAMCQNCSILLVEADSNSYANLMTAVDMAASLGANAISNSYGSNEFSGETSYDAHFNRPGTAITFSSGDSGYGAEYPAASQYVTAVGGTTLTLNADKSWRNETVWSGTGSGCSAFESKPAWQSDALCSQRAISDVSADADPSTGAAVYDTVRYQGRSGWFKVGGTSLASPLIAATYVLAGVPSGIQANSLPYGSPANLHDVVSGSNGSCGTYLCTAGNGYDGPTGLGTPNGLGAF